MLSDYGTFDQEMCAAALIDTAEFLGYGYAGPYMRACGVSPKDDMEHLYGALSERGFKRPSARAADTGVDCGEVKP